MKTIVFNYHGSTLDRSAEAVALKAGYLLGDIVYTAGSTAIELYAKQSLANLSSVKELEFLEHIHRNDPESMEQITQMKNVYKTLNKIKYKQPNCLATFKKAQKSLHDWFMLTIEEMYEHLDGLGFKELKTMISEGVFGCYFIDQNPENECNGSIAASNLLQRLFPGLQVDEEPEIFFLGNEFLNDTYAKPELYKAGDKEAADTNNIYLHKCFRLPNINPLSVTELQTVRKQLQQVGTLFRKNTNEWIDMCYFNDDVADRISFFTNHVLPAAQTLQQNIADNNILQLCNRLQNGTSQLEVWMGEMPVWQLWNFYKDHNVIKDETWVKLERLKDDKEYKDKRWPVMMLALVKEEIEQLFNDEAEEIKSCKKYILID